MKDISTQTEFMKKKDKRVLAERVDKISFVQVLINLFLLEPKYSLSNAQSSVRSSVLHRDVLSACPSKSRFPMTY